MSYQTFMKCLEHKVHRRAGVVDPDDWDVETGNSPDNRCVKWVFDS